MLPHDTWYDYYDEPCDICEDQIQARDDEHGWCEECNKIMCLDCITDALCECNLCRQTLDAEYEPDSPNLCKECLEICQICQLSFHPGCKNKHDCKTSKKRGLNDTKTSELEKEEEVEEVVVVEEGDGPPSKRRSC
jgi:hypothetical protein